MTNDREPLKSCDDIVQLLWDYLDAELDAARVAAVRGHLEACAHCRDHFTFEGAFLRTFEAMINEPLETSALRARIVAALRVDGYGMESRLANPDTA